MAKFINFKGVVVNLDNVASMYYGSTAAAFSMLCENYVQYVICRREEYEELLKQIGAITIMVPQEVANSNNNSELNIK